MEFPNAHSNSMNCASASSSNQTQMSDSVKQLTSNSKENSNTEINDKLFNTGENKLSENIFDGEGKVSSQRRTSSSSYGSNPPTPQPQTPAGSGMMPFSPGSPQAIGDPVHDLPLPLLNIGWRKFWSNREQRPYFFNKFTNESSWEMPVINAQVSY